jgi:hypothetical protein
MTEGHSIEDIKTLILYEDEIEKKIDLLHSLSQRLRGNQKDFSYLEELFLTDNSNKVRAKTVELLYEHFYTKKEKEIKTLFLYLYSSEPDSIKEIIRYTKHRVRRKIGMFFSNPIFQIYSKYFPIFKQLEVLLDFENKQIIRKDETFIISKFLEWRGKITKEHIIKRYTINEIIQLEKDTLSHNNLTINKDLFTLVFYILKDHFSLPKKTLSCLLLKGDLLENKSHYYIKKTNPIEKGYALIKPYYILLFNKQKDLSALLHLKHRHSRYQLCKSCHKVFAKPCHKSSTDQCYECWHNTYMRNDNIPKDLREITDLYAFGTYNNAIKYLSDKVLGIPSSKKFLEELTSRKDYLSLRKHIK